MTTRKNTFLLKRSNVPGKVPSPGDLQLGELALNTSDVILYASGTTTNQILPIGWDRIHRTGDTVTGDFNFYGDLTISGSSLPNGYALSVTGDTNFTGDVYVNGDLFYNGSVVITGSTNIQNGLTADTIYTDYIDFNTSATVTTQFGRINWDSGTGTLNIGIGDSTTGLIDFQVGQEEVVRVFNSEVTTLQKGEIVYVSGSQGNRPAVKRAQAQADLYSVTTLGMVDSPITSGGQGYVTTFGIISNLNTLGLTGGTPVWLSPTTPGTFTSTKPQAPNHTVLIGYVVRVSATVGSIFVNISNGWELDEIHDVRINGVTEGDLLMRSSYSGSPVWVNTKTLNGSYTITGDTTIGGNLVVSGNSGVNWFSSNTSSDLVRITQTGTGNAFVVEDSTNPDSSQFVIDQTGKVGIGLTTPLYPLHISTAAVASTNEPIVRIQVSDASSYFAINNATSSDSVFVPEILGRGAPGNSQIGVIFGAYIDSTQDVGTNPITVFRSGLSSLSVATTRPLFDFRNISTSVMTIAANGNVGIGDSTPESRLTIVTSASTTGSYPAISGTTQTGDIARLRNGGSNLVFDIGGFSSNGNWLQSTNQTDLSLTYPLLLNPNGGKVGINLTTPSENLHVSGNTYITGKITTDSVLTMPNFKYIQTKNDFPTAIGGVITLSGDTTYFINTTIDLTGDRLVAGQNTTLLGGSSESSKLKSTGLLGTALITSNYSLPIRGLSLESDVVLNLNANGVSNQNINWFGVNFTNSNTIGLIKDYSNVIWTDCTILESANLTFSGTIDTIGFNTCLFNGTSGNTIFNIPSGCSITRRFRPIYSTFIVSPGETGITISNSAIVNNDAFILDTINFTSGGTYISGLDASSPKCLFSNNVGILNSSNVGHYYMINNTTNTTIGIPNVNVWVKAAGTTTIGIGNSPRWVGSGNNRIIYTGNTVQDFKFTAVGTVQSAAVNQVISVGVAINGTIQNESEITVRTATANQPYPFAIQDLVSSLSAGDYIEVFVLNTNSNDIRVGDLNVIIDKISV